MRFPLLLLTLVICACGESTAPTSRVPKLGTYTYSSTLVGTGTLRLTYATADSVAGTWNVISTNGVGSMSGVAQQGYWDTDAYQVYGLMRFPEGATTPYTVRMAVNGDAIRCTVQRVGDATSLSPCTLAWTQP